VDKLVPRSMAYKAVTHDYRPPMQGGDPIWDGTPDVLLPIVPLDTSENVCGTGGGWHYCERMEDALRIVGLWPDGWPSVVAEVRPEGLVIQRGSKCRTSSLRMIRVVPEEEVREGVYRLSAPFGAHQDDMTTAQMQWRGALGRPLHDPEAVALHLQVALDTRELPWTLQRLDTAWDAWDARAAWAAWAARAAWAAWDAWAAWAAWAARAAWDARAAWAAWDAWAAWAAWAAQDALTVQYAVRQGWSSSDPQRLTLGLQDAYAAGLFLAGPIGPDTLGWVMVPSVTEEECSG